MATLDFSAARSQHLAWKGKLNEFLEDRATLTAAQVTSHKDCDLGEWLYSSGLQRFGYVAGMKELEKLHAELHATVKRVIQMKESGNAAGAAQEFNRIGPMSDKIISLLKGVEKQIELTH